MHRYCYREKHSEVYHIERDGEPLCRRRVASGPSAIIYTNQPPLDRRLCYHCLAVVRPRLWCKENLEIEKHVARVNSISDYMAIVYAIDRYQHIRIFRDDEKDISWLGKDHLMYRACQDSLWSNYTDWRINFPSVLEKWSSSARRIPKAIERSVLKRDKFTCQRCGAINNLECDHRVPVRFGGSTRVNNLELLCHRCNYNKLCFTVTSGKLQVPAHFLLFSESEIRKLAIHNADMYHTEPNWKEWHCEALDNFHALYDNGIIYDGVLFSNTPFLEGAYEISAFPDRIDMQIQNTANIKSLYSDLFIDWPTPEKAQACEDLDSDEWRKYLPPKKI